MDVSDIKANFLKRPINVRHQDLQRAGESDYRSKCPKCEDGVLLMGRDRATFELLADDNCTSCGRRFHYTDLSQTGLV